MICLFITQSKFVQNPGRLIWILIMIIISSDCPQIRYTNTCQLIHVHGHLHRRKRCFLSFFGYSKNPSFSKRFKKWFFFHSGDFTAWTASTEMDTVYWHHKIYFSVFTFRLPFLINLNWLIYLSILLINCTSRFPSRAYTYV